jgi:hypothetical protein
MPYEAQYERSMVGASGIEPLTLATSKQCSAPELRAFNPMFLPQLRYTSLGAPFKRHQYFYTPEVE